MNCAIIIILSTLAAVNLTCGNVISSAKEKVKGGEFIYYNISIVDTYMHLQLISTSGDCDLYVSETVDLPTYNDYSLSSATCGVDSVIIPRRDKGQIHIGIYGHPAHEISECYLNVCLLETIEKKDGYTDELTEIAFWTEAVIEEKCKKNDGSYFGRSYLSRLLSLISNSQIDHNIFVELLIFFVDALG